VSALTRKLMRDLARLKAQIVSIAAVVACGVASVIAMRSTLGSIQRSRDAYYQQTRFAHVFASLKRAPESVGRRLAKLDGVAAVETRVTAVALLEVPGLAESAQGFVVSLPEDGEPVLGQIQLRGGHAPAPRSQTEVLINEHFASANSLHPGDSVNAVVNGRWRRFQIVGIATSPEYIYDASAGAGQFGDSKHHGILWIRRNALEALYDMSGAFNDVAILMARGARERAVIESVDALLRPYGGGHAYGRADQPSNRVLSGEVEQLRVFGTAMPLIFLTVAAFLLNTVLSRLVATQREEIATLKAFGYTNGAIARHYLGYPLTAVALGSIGGVALGIWVGGLYTELYAKFFRFPGFAHYTSPTLVALAIAVSGGAAVIGALNAVRGAVRLAPAEGMRPAAPTVFRPLLLEWLGWGALLSPPMRMVLRNIERRPGRAATSIIGVAFAAAVLVVGTFAFDSARYMSELQFTRVEREALSVAFTSARPVSVRHELAAIDGVTAVELYRVVPIRIHKGHHSRQLVVIGLESRGQLRRLVDREGRAHPVPVDGLALTTTLAHLLDAGIGDTVQIELLEQGGLTRQQRVVAKLDELMGIAGYMELHSLNRLMREGAVVSGAYLMARRDSEPAVVRRLSLLPYVAATTTRRAMLKSFEDQIAESLRLTVTIVVSLAAVIALGVIYNGIRISFSERSRELASLRVLGFTAREVAALLFGEQAVIDILGTAIGLLLGLALANWVAASFETELYRFPVVVSARTYGLAVAVVFAAAIGASLTMLGRVYRLDLVAVLKARE
jgi:putative ABC transport system permease protein